METYEYLPDCRDGECVTVQSYHLHELSAKRIQLFSIAVNDILLSEGFKPYQV